MLVLLVTSFIFLFIAVYAISYMNETEMQSEHIFISCMLMFLGTMSMVTLADHPIVLWIAIEATTLVSAPLIFINRSKEALEATWKYVLICSVGIALALLGCFFITLAMDIKDIDAPLTFSSLNAVAGQLDPIWLKAGFIFVMIGFGTKMGLAPMHTWLPDAHSQAPSPASALLSGALLNCAFLGIYKVHTLMYVAGLGAYSSNILIGFGLVSMLVAGIFILNQPDYKRMLAYSSVENMGVIAFGVGIGGIALYGAILHLIHHSLIKSSLFLSAGNILLGFGSRLVKRTGNLARLFPKTFVVLLRRVCRRFRFSSLRYLHQRTADHHGGLSGRQVCRHGRLYLLPDPGLCRGGAHRHADFLYQHQRGHSRRGTVLPRPALLCAPADLDRPLRLDAGHHL